ncbi:MAG: type 4a pilus biogenesis protein PilO [Gemmatimonadota bacterium]
MLGLDSPDRQRMALFGLLLVGGAVLFHRYVWSPLHDDRIATETHLARLDRTNRQARALTQPTRISELERLESEYEVALAAYEPLFPHRSEAMGLLAGVSSAALSADVEIVSFAPREKIEGKVLVEIPYEVEVQGSYHDIGRFLAGVINLPQIVRPEVINLAGVFDDDPDRGELEHQVLGTLVLSAYVRASQEIRIEPARNAALPESSGGVHAVRSAGGPDEG